MSDIISTRVFALRAFTRIALLATIPIVATACSNSDAPHTDDTASAAHVTCTDMLRVDTLPAILSEASGVAASTTHNGILWVHNDGGNSPLLVAIDTLARIRASIRINLPDIQGMDFEDVAVAQCGTRDCIYLADIGDNYAQRTFIRILRFNEPDPATDSVTAPPQTFAMRFPDGGHDAEAIFILPGERLFVVTKGRNGPVALYEYPGPLSTDTDTATLRHIQDFTPGIVQFPEMVTGATASRDGKRVAIRTYAYLHFYKPGPADSLKILEPSTIPLAEAREFQGEGITIRPDGAVFLVGERSLDRLPPPLTRLSCR